MVTYDFDQGQSYEEKVPIKDYESEDKNDIIKEPQKIITK